MADYRKMYFRLAHEVSRTILALQEIQAECEEIYLKEEEMGKLKTLSSLEKKETFPTFPEYYYTAEN